MSILLSKSLQNRGDLAFVREFSRFCLFIDHCTVGFHFENTARPRDQISFHSETLPQFIRQTDGIGFVVSHLSVFDGDFHAPSKSKFPKVSSVFFGYSHLCRALGSEIPPMPSNNSATFCLHSGSSSIGCPQAKLLRIVVVDGLYLVAVPPDIVRQIFGGYSFEASHPCFEIKIA